MRGLRRALAGIAVVGLALGVLSCALVLSSDFLPRREVEAALVALIGAAFIGTGLFAWLRRPDNRVGALMVAIGMLVFLGRFNASSVPLLFTIGTLFATRDLAVAVHLLLAFPSGRIGTRWGRAVVFAGYFNAFVLGGVLILVDDFRSTGAGAESGETLNLLLVEANASLSEAIILVQNAAALLVAVATAVLLARGWRTAPAPTRRALAPVLWAGAAVTGLFATLFLARVVGAPEAVEIALRWGSLLAYAGVPFAFLAGLLRSRFFRAGAVSQLVERLGAATDPAGLRDALAEALGDPSLELAYWVPEKNRFVDADGRAMSLPDDGERVASEVEQDGRRVAAIIHDASLCDEPELVRAIGAAAALALERQRLAAELRARIEELQASRARIVVAGDAERRRIERDLHDGAQQRLVSMLLTVKLARRQAVAAGGGDDLAGPEAFSGELLDELEDELTQALAELRALARGILPPVLNDLGLAAAVEELATRSPVPVELAELPEKRLPPKVETVVYFVVAEALTNVAKYSRASRAEVRVSRRNGSALIEVRDDGIGGADPDGGSGLRGLDDRVGAVGGRLELDSPPGRGTSLRAEIPCAS